MLVDVDSMSAAERAALLARLGAGDDAGDGAATSGEIAVEVDGRTYTIDPKRLVSWNAVNLMATMNDEGAGQSERFLAAVQFFNYVMGKGISQVVQACGGGDASTQDVLDLATRILKAAQPKAQAKN